MKEIVVNIDTNGKPTFEVKGVKGKRCLDLTRDIEKSLGGKVLERKFTREYNQSEIDAAQTTKLGGS